jgi:pimeloyl-ACP methyl ester carboxylesterase
MTWPKLAASLILALVLTGLVALTLWRAARRAERAETDYPALGDFVTVDGRRVHYLMRGQGPDLVLIHGASGNLRDMLPLIDLLAPRYRVIAFDRPGLGHTEALAPRGKASLRDQAEVLRAAASSLGAENPVVVGQSFGGSVALAWALEWQPPALVLISAPSMPWLGKLDIWYRLTDGPAGPLLFVPLAAAFVPDSYGRRMVPHVFHPQPVPPFYAETIGVPLAMRRASLWHNAEQVNALRAQLVSMQPRYRSLALPVELVHGTADTIVPLGIHSEPLSALLPNATLTVIDGAGHMPHHSHSEIVLAAIDRVARSAGLR